jgi:hypothetical protein
MRSFARISVVGSHHGQAGDCRVDQGGHGYAGLRAGLVCVPRRAAPKVAREATECSARPSLRVPLWAIFRRRSGVPLNSSSKLDLGTFCFSPGSAIRGLAGTRTEQQMPSVAHSRRIGIPRALSPAKLISGIERQPLSRRSNLSCLKILRGKPVGASLANLTLQISHCSSDRKSKPI